MGSSCCKKNEYEAIEEVPAQWSEAVTQGEVMGVQYLHADDPGLVDKPVDKSGRKALHVAAEKNYTEIVEYLLKNGANANSKAPRTGDTALHEASRVNAIPIIRLLLQFGANPELTNRKGQKPQQLCNEATRKEFAKTKLKQYREAASQDGKENQGDDIRIAGQSVQQFVITKQEKEREELENSKETNEVPTEFGKSTGIELSEVSDWLKRLSKKETIWNKSVGSNKKELDQNRALFKLVFTLVLAALRTKEREASLKNNNPSIKNLCRKLQDKLKKSNKKGFILTKDQFMTEFHNYLMEIHEELVEEAKAM